MTMMIIVAMGARSVMPSLPLAGMHPASFRSADGAQSYTIRDSSCLSRSSDVRRWRSTQILGWKMNSPIRFRNVEGGLTAAGILESHMLDDPVEGVSEPTSIGEYGTPVLTDDQRWAAVKAKLGGIVSNAQKHSKGLRHSRHSLGVDVGDSRTGVAISLTGYAPRPLSVLYLKGQRLIDDLLQIASKERADEFIVGLPTSFDGTENVQSQKTRSFAGRLASQAALRGWRVYLMDEYGSSQDGLGYMLEIGMKKQSRKEKLDAYAALVLLHSYFGSKGARVRLVVPKGLSCQERLCLGDTSTEDDNFGYY